MPDDFEMLQGTLNVLILKALSWGPRNGYAVGRWIRETSDGTLEIEEGALYPALHRMEARGWVVAEWGVSENNRRAKFYRLSAAGRQQLRAKLGAWARFIDGVEKVLRANAQGT
jgi:transcriptional regulator